MHQPTVETTSPTRAKFPLYLRILLAVALGIICARILGPSRTVRLNDLGSLVIRLLKTLATPLVFVAVIDAFIRTEIPASKGVRLVVIAVINAAVAVTIGLVISHVIQGGKQWSGQLSRLIQQAGARTGSGPSVPHNVHPSIHPLDNLASFIPKSVVEPFSENQIITVVLAAVLVGVALRRMKRSNSPEILAAITTTEQLVRLALGILVQILEWIIAIIPFAVFGLVSHVVALTGPKVFGILGIFLATVLLGLAVHAFAYYSLLLKFIGGFSPVKFYRGATDAMVTALSCGSSLATLPITLRCLTEKLGVSQSSARLAACVGTNLNHDGIILYEAATALFVAQALGMHLSLSQQVYIALASVMAGIGIAGVPEAGLITLPLVLNTAGLDERAVAQIIPLLMLVDWLIGRCRATTNVLSDMTVAVLLDRPFGKEKIAGPAET